MENLRSNSPYLLHRVLFSHAPEKVTFFGECVSREETWNSGYMHTCEFLRLVSCVSKSIKWYVFLVQNRRLGRHAILHLPRRIRGGKEEGKGKLEESLPCLHLLHVSHVLTVGRLVPTSVISFPVPNVTRQWRPLLCFGKFSRVLKFLSFFFRSKDNKYCISGRRQYSAVGGQRCLQLSLSWINACRLILGRTLWKQEDNLLHGWIRATWHGQNGCSL